MHKGSIYTSAAVLVLLLCCACVIPVVESCTKITLDGQCYSCCGNITGIYNNKCMCNYKPCPRCSTPLKLTVPRVKVTPNTHVSVSVSAFEHTAGYESSPQLVFTNLTHDQCPSECSFKTPAAVCYSVWACDSVVRKNTLYTFMGYQYPYMMCVYDWHLFKLSNYFVYFCDNAQCDNQKSQITYTTGCNTPQAVSSTCDGGVLSVMALKC